MTKGIFQIRVQNVPTFFGANVYLSDVAIRCSKFLADYRKELITSPQTSFQASVVMSKMTTPKKDGVIFDMGWGYFGHDLFACKIFIFRNGKK